MPLSAIGNDLNKVPYYQTADRPENWNKRQQNGKIHLQHIVFVTSCRRLIFRFQVHFKTLRNADSRQAPEVTIQFLRVSIWLSSGYVWGVLSFMSCDYLLCPMKSFIGATNKLCALILSAQSHVQPREKPGLGHYCIVSLFTLRLFPRDLLTSLCNSHQYSRCWGKISDWFSSKVSWQHVERSIPNVRSCVAEMFIHALHWATEQVNTTRFWSDQGRPDKTGTLLWTERKKFWPFSRSGAQSTVPPAKNFLHLSLNY